MVDEVPVITIDGPSASGKGTVSKMLANELGWRLLDSGALYRVLALVAKKHAVDWDDKESIELLAAHMDVQFETGGDLASVKVILEGQEVTDDIRTEDIGNGASCVAKYSKVRDALVDRQRAFKEPPGLVADGRDMGTVIFPEASLRIFLTASVEERAFRRYKQLKEKGMNVMLDALIREVSERDVRDTSRAVAPLKPSDGAVIIDTTDVSVPEVFEQIMKEAGAVFNF